MTDDIKPSRPPRRYEVTATVPMLGSRSHVIKAQSENEAKEKMARAYSSHNLSADSCWANALDRLVAA